MNFVHRLKKQKNDAASKIQALFKGKQARRLVKELRASFSGKTEEVGEDKGEEPSDTLEDELDYEEAAAAKGGEPDWPSVEEFLQNR